MSLFINREPVDQKGCIVPGSARHGGLGRIASGMKVSTNRSDSVGLDRFMRNMAALFVPNQNQPFGAEGSVRE